MKRVFLILILSLLVTVPLSAQSDFTFDPAPCPVAIPFSFVEDTGAGGIECGFVTVPEFHAQPDGNTIRVAVAKINSSSASPAPDPLFIEQGGPGGSTIDIFLPIAPLFLPILGERDIILVEQRGTLYSEPALVCPEVLEQTLATIGGEQSLDDFAGEGGAYGACLNRLTDEGVNLSAFNSVENAADMIAVADAFGYEQINFYGVSYGTMLGQHVLRDYEDRIRSIIFDAVVPLEFNFLPDSIATASQAIDVVIEQCAVDDLCNSLYPDLETVTFDTVAALNDSPVTIPIYDPETGEAYDAFFNGDIFLQILRAIQYDTTLLPSIPAFINATANGDYEWAERLYGVFSIAAARQIADGMFISTICAEDADFTDADVTVTDVREEYINNQLLLPSTIQAICGLANVDQLAGYVDDPVVSSVPALITSGQFDPITPPRYADVLAGNLENSLNLEFAGVGHGALIAGMCPLGIITDFVNAPESEIDTSCMDDMGVTFNEFTTDPTGRLQFPLPDGLTDVSGEDFASYQNESGDLTLSIIAIDDLDIPVAIEAALNTVVRDGFSTPPLQSLEQESPLGLTVTNIYQDGVDLLVVFALNVEDVTGVVVIDFPPTELFTIQDLVAQVGTNLYRVD